uniref:PdxS/SNZ N-terminal domain-containing protein n=1 Tax=Oryza glumipatula TaxID=40148 RepID=A0A0D9ZWI8_9ORYZ
MGEIHALRNMDDDEVFAYAKRIAAPYNLVMQTKQLGRLPVVQFAAGGNRYMVMEAFIDTAGKGQSDPLILTQLNITKAIRDSIQINFGECGLAACLGSLQVKYVNPITKLCVIRVSREDHQKVWAAITMVRSIGKIPVSFNLRDVSGSIRACKKAALECEEAKFEYYKLAAGDRITPKFVETMESCFNKIKGLES